MILKRPDFQFALRFLAVFGSLYGFNIAFIGLVNPGGLYIPFLHEHVNYIESWKNILLGSSAAMIELLGYEPHLTVNHLRVGKGGIILSYSCLGYGVCSFFAAFICSLPGSNRHKLFALIPGLLFIQVLNISRIILLCLFWRNSLLSRIIPHHLLFDLLIYSTVMGLIILWAKKYSGINGVP